LFGGERGAKNGSFDFAWRWKVVRAKANVPFVCRLKKFCAVGIFLFFSTAWLSALFRLAVADNVLGVWRSGFDLEAGTVNLTQNYLLKAKLANLHD
jgi:hypothetical protein